MDREKTTAEKERAREEARRRVARNMFEDEKRAGRETSFEICYRKVNARADKIDAKKDRG